MISVAGFRNRLKTGRGQVEIGGMNHSDPLTGSEVNADTCLAGQGRSGAPIGPAWDRGLARQAEQDARSMFAHVLQAWAMDVLALRACGLDVPVAGERGGRLALAA